MTIFSLSDSLRDTNGKTGFNPIGKGDYSCTQMVPRKIKALGLGCIVMMQGGRLTSASRQRCMPSRHVQQRI
jgi:hypothetical protein